TVSYFSRPDRAAGGVLDPHEGDGAGGRAAAGELLLRRAEAGPVRADARAVLEQPRALAHQPPDVVEVVLDGDDEAGARLRTDVGVHLADDDLGVGLAGPLPVLDGVGG